MKKDLRHFILFPDQSRTLEVGREKRFLCSVLLGDDAYQISGVVHGIAPLSSGEVYVVFGQWLARRSALGWAFWDASKLGLGERNPIDVAVSPDESWLCVISAKTLIGSRDGGNSWQKIPVPINRLEWVRLFSAGKMAIIGMDGAYFSNNYGETWQPIPVSNVRDVCMAPDVPNYLFVKDIYGNTHCLIAAQQPDDQNAPLEQTVFTLSKKPALGIFCGNDALYLLDKEGIVKYDLMDISFAPRRVLSSRTIMWAGWCQEERFVVKKRGGIFSYSAQDNNRRWSKMLSAEPHWFSVCAVRKQGAFYAGTYSGYLLETHDQGREWVITSLKSLVGCN